MKFMATVLLALLLIFVISSTSGASKQEEDDLWLWLNKISGGQPPEINVTGKWRDTEGSGLLTWGEGHLRQEQNKVSGVIGDYNVIGIVSGKKVYLVFLYRGAVYYTARLEMSQDLLTGNYFNAKDKEQKKGYPTSFTKVVDPTKK
jgi:hypothetical protein